MDAVSSRVESLREIREDEEKVGKSETEGTNSYLNGDQWLARWKGRYRHLMFLIADVSRFISSLKSLEIELYQFNYSTPTRLKYTTG